jgi:hypothetical protein
MKKPVSLKFIFSSAILAWVLVGDHSVQNSNAQTQPVPQPGTDLTATPPDNAPTAGALPPDIDPNSPLAQIIHLVQAGVEQSVILTYINNSTSLFNLNSNEIIYLNDLGVPTEIINAMMQRDQQLQQMRVTAGTQPTQPAVTTETAAPQPANTTEITAPQPTEVTVNYFYDTLAPYGGWVNVEGCGWCWRPTIVIYNTGWQPYCNDGHWVYTDQGWYWISGYSWGWATFHYGRWFHNPRYGWCWWPDTTWAPSWVCWRYNRDYCGWAPLPPHAVYQTGIGFVYQGRTVSAGFSFGLSANVFTFVPTRDFCNRQPWRYRINAGEVPRIYVQTTVINDIRFDSRHQGIVNAGIPPHDITAVTRQEIRPVAIRGVSGNSAGAGHREQFESDGRTLIVNRPHFVGTPVLSLHQGQGAAPTTGHGQNEFHPNQNPHPNLNRFTPQSPQARLPEVPHSTAPYPQARNNVITTPPRNYSTWPAQNQTPNHNYGSDNKNMSPRARENATVEQPFSSPPAVNHYSPPEAFSQNNYRPPPNESRDHNQYVNHSEPPPQADQPHPSYRSSSSSSQQSSGQGQGKANGQNGH